MQSKSGKPESIFPREELEARISRFQELLCDSGIDLALIRQNADMFYLTGTVQDAHLLVPSDGEPVFLVWRVFDRAREESSLKHIYPLASLSALPGMLRDLGLDSPRMVGLEMDVLPAFLYRFYRERLWPRASVKDVSALLRHVRCIKSPAETDLVRQACRQVSKALEIVPGVLREGLSELELSTAVEAELRKRGHCGLLRMRLWNQEVGMGQILSGPSAAVPSWTSTPMGGVGPCPAFGMGASSRRIGRSEPVSIDIGGWVNGYCCDQTRIFSLGPLPDEMQKAFRIAVEIIRMLEREMKPGAVCAEVYDMAVKYAENKGLDKHFMGYGRSRVRFVGHGLGIELDEYPFIAMGNKMVLKEDMILALEPKFVFPGMGAVGLENTYRVGHDGLEQLTVTPEEVSILDF